jgi:hypothetical protein
VDQTLGQLQGLGPEHPISQQGPTTALGFQQERLQQSTGHTPKGHPGNLATQGWPAPQMEQGLGIGSPC